jgi:hypothetical protein
MLDCCAFSLSKRAGSRAIAFDFNLANQLPNPHLWHSQFGSHSPTCNPARKAKKHEPRRRRFADNYFEKRTMKSGSNPSRP